MINDSYGYEYYEYDWSYHYWIDGLDGLDGLDGYGWSISGKMAMIHRYS
jgi:hypothetical protein